MKEKTENEFFENINKNDKSLSRLRQKKKTQLTKSEI